MLVLTLLLSPNIRLDKYITALLDYLYTFFMTKMFLVMLLSLLA